MNAVLRLVIIEASHVSLPNWDQIDYIFISLRFVHTAFGVAFFVLLSCAHCAIAWYVLEMCSFSSFLLCYECISENGENNWIVCVCVCLCLVAFCTNDESEKRASTSITSHRYRFCRQDNGCVLLVQTVSKAWWLWMLLFSIFFFSSVWFGF